MSQDRSWEGNWKARLYERVHDLGYQSLTAFAAARPAASLATLADELGKDDIAGVQVLSGLLAEAEQLRQVKRFERDVFARMFTQSLPHGWPAVLDDPGRFAVAKALASWIGYTPETDQERARQVMMALLANPPPPGWRPLGPDDELLRTLLPDDEA